MPPRLGHRGLAPDVVVGPVTVKVTPVPLAVSDPPVIVKPPLIVELAATVSPPPEMTSGSSAVILFTDSTFEPIVTVGRPDTLMTTSSPGPGTVPVLQLLATSQEPLVAEIQVTVDSSCRSSNLSTAGRLPRRRRQNTEPWGLQTDSWTWCAPLMMMICCC